MSMIPALIGAAAALASTIYSGVKQREAQNAFDQSITQSQAEAKRAYETDYYTNYLDRAPVQSLLSQMRQQSQERNEALANSAVVTGATPEFVLAQKKNEADSYTQALSQIAAQGDAVSQQAQNRYYNTLQDMDARRQNLYAQQLSMQSQNHLNNLQNSWGAVANAAGRLINT